VSAVAATLLVLTLVVAVGDWLAVARQDFHLNLVCRPLVLLLLIGVTIELQPSSSEAWAWFLIALVCSLLGDLTLMFQGALTPTSLGFFVAAHLAYLGGLVFLGLDGPRLVVGVLLSAVALLALGRTVLRGVQTRQPGLVEPVRAYIAVVSAMAVAAFAVGRPLGVVGAGLFYAADAMGGWNRFVHAYPVLPLATIVAYHLGQIALVLSLV
jgi:uncharacterized membrane protein YhhN